MVASRSMSSGKGVGQTKQNTEGGNGGGGDNKSS
jgi:hypothetical protein